MPIQAQTRSGCRPHHMKIAGVWYISHVSNAYFRSHT